ncbi:arginine ABC transporter periplasmic binding protein [Gammaproteobacteria bacterium]|nr:arginine ABC transporter periplasmic binding protein [Gammaproteobacteria bacterium]
MKTKLLCGLLILSASFVQAQTLKFGLNAGYQPFEFKNSDNDIVGFDIDIAKSICADLKLTCEFVDQAFDSLIPNLRLKRFDAIISAMDITKERAKNVSFSDSYYKNAALFIAPKGKFKLISDLNGKKIGVQNGTTHQKYMNDVFKDANINAYPQFPSAIIDMANGRVDAVFGDDSTLAEYLKNDANLEIVEHSITDPAYFGAGFGIAVRLDDKEMLDKINQSLKNINENGTYKTIYTTWFGKRD